MVPAALTRSPVALPATVPPFYAAMGAVLREARSSAGLTQEDVANAVFLTRTSLTNIEKGRQKVLLHTFIDIAKHLGRSSSELLAEVEAKMVEEVPAPEIPKNLPPKTHEQISEIIAAARESKSHAKSPSSAHPRKSRGAAPAVPNHGTRGSG